MNNQYQVVLLAGGARSGSLLYPLCAHYPKALLPVANKPMILYQLELIENVGFTEVLVLLSKNNSKIEQVLSHHKKIKIEIAYISDDSESCDALLQVKDKIRKNFILMSIDIMTEVDLLSAIDFHNRERATITMILKEEDLQKKQGKVPISASLDEGFEIMLISGNQLVQICEETAVARSENILAFSEIQIRTNLIDSHIYICSHSILELLTQLPTMNNFKEEALPFLAKNQNNPQMLKFIPEPNGFFSERDTKKFKIATYITQHYIRRVNNIKDYQQANFEALTKGDKQIRCFVPTTNNDIIPYKGQAKISPDSLVGENCQINDKCVITRSIIGKGTRIGENCKIINSIILKDVIINANCVIQNCVIANNTYIEMGSVLERCQTASQASITGKYVDEAIE